MAQFVMHYYRYFDKVEISKAGGGTVTISEGWNNLTTILAALRVGGVTCSWTYSTNATAFSPAITCPDSRMRNMLGIASGSQSASTFAPLDTFCPQNSEYRQELAPVGVSGKRRYDTDFYQSLSGQTWAMGSVTTHAENFILSMVSKHEMFSTGTDGVSAPFIDSVYRPDEGIVFEVVYRDDVSCASGYVEGGIWCHKEEPESEMSMPPWDLYYGITIPANLWVGV